MFSLVLPFHGDVSRLIETMKLVSSSSVRFRISEVLLCHNGKELSEDDRSLIRTFEGGIVKFHHTDSKGLGAGYRLGIKNSNQPYIVLSASDLPFGFSDVEEFLKRTQGGSFPRFAIGSKAHPESRLFNYTFTRRFFSFTYYLCRIILLGVKSPKDSQGTIIIENELAKALEQECTSDDYFFSTELCAFAIAHEVIISELPIIIRQKTIEGPSSVNLITDSIALFKKLIEIRSRLKVDRNSIR